MKTVTVSGMIARHDSKPFRGAVTINTETGLITAVAKATKKTKADYVFGDECLIFPGFGDVHIHAREDDSGKQVYKEEYA
ncbi:amidohydrolase, partial [Candidatus Kaiserbacteria bacterium]|nr:amidohydrolase [Candidatus Kaiserbacteria bacterium]